MADAHAVDSLRRAARSVAGINAAIAQGCARVATLDDLLEHDSGGDLVPDVVSLAFSCPFAGTAAMLCVPVAGRGVFTKAERIWLNGVPCLPGPAPNERLGVVDTLVVADRPGEGERATRDGAAVIADLLGGRSVRIDCQAVEGTRFACEAALAEIEFARLYVYSALIPAPSCGPVPFLAMLGAGTRIQVNDADAVLIGVGSRDREGAPTISFAADMHGMDASLFAMSDRASMRHVIAAAIPVTEPGLLDALVNWGRGVQAEGARDDAARNAATRLAGRIRTGEFLLTASDLPL